MPMRITQKYMDAVCERVNRVAGTPLTPYTKLKDGSYKTNIGNYHIDNAYGGVRLVQMMHSGGGIRVVSEGGYTSKRDLCSQMHVFITGLQTANERKVS